MMKKRNKQPRVGVPSLIVASTQPDLPGNLELACYGCRTCGHEFASNSKIEPFCVACGSDQVENEGPVTDPEVDEQIADEAELSSLHCPECGTNMILPDSMLSTASTNGGTVHCSACGTELSFDVSENADEFVPEDADLISTGDDLVDDEFVTDQGSPEDEDGAFASTKSKSKKPAAKRVTASDELDDGEEIIDPMASETDELSGSGDPVPVPAGDEIDVNLMDALDEEEAKSKSCAWVQASSNTILAMVGDKVIAKLDNNDAYQHKEIFGKVPHIRAMTASLQTNGIKTTLKEFGFKPVVIRVSAKAIRANQIAAAVKTASDEVRSQAAVIAETLKQCMGIAASGLNKGFFKGKTQPLKSRMFTALQTAGMQRPERIIDSVFAASSDDYHRVLFETAMELMEKPVDVRNGIAEAIGGSNYVAVSSDSSDNDEETTDDSAISDRLEQTMSPVQSSVTNIHESISTIGRGRLFNFR